MRKNTDFTLGEIAMSSCPMSTPASSTAVTFPRLNFPNFSGPTPNPIPSAARMAISGYCRSVWATQSTRLPVRRR